MSDDVDLGIHLETLCARLERGEEVDKRMVVGALRCLGRLFAQCAQERDTLREKLEGRKK